MITQLRRRGHRATVRHAQVGFAPGSSRLETAATLQLDELVQMLPLGVDPVTTVTAMMRPATVNPQPRLTAMLRAWKVSSYLRDGGLGGTVITRTSVAPDDSTTSLGTVLVAIEYLE